MGHQIDIVMSNVFREYFTRIAGLDRKLSPFLIYQPTAINQKPITIIRSVLTLLKVCS